VTKHWSIICLCYRKV